MLYFLLIVCSMLLWLANTADAATYYVAKTGSDSRSCTQAQSASTPKLTIRSGLSCLSAGDTLIIRGGTYMEGNLNAPGGSGEGSRVTVASSPGETVIIDASGFDEGISNPPGRDYLTWQDIKLKNASHYGAGIFSKHVRFVRMEISNIFGDTGGGSSSGTGLSISCSAPGDCADYFEFIESKVHHIGWGNAQCGPPFGPANLGCHGFYWSAAHGLIDRSQIYNIVGHGIQVYTSSGCPGCYSNVFRNSIWHDITWGWAIGVYQGFNSIYNNVIYNSLGGVGLYASNNLVANNTAYSNNMPGGQNKGISGDGNDGPGYPNNTFVNNIAYNNNGGNITNVGGSTYSNNLCNPTTTFPC